MKLYEKYFTQCACQEPYGSLYEAIKDTSAMTAQDIPYAMTFIRNAINTTSNNILMFAVSEPNEKLEKEIGAYSFDLLAGVTCGNADKCRSYVQVSTPSDSGETKMGITSPGKEQGGFFCFAARGERNPSVYLKHYWNTILVRKLGSSALIRSAIERTLASGHMFTISKATRGEYQMIDGKWTAVSEPTFELRKGDKITFGKYFRLHASGDFLETIKGCMGESAYLKAWADVASNHKTGTPSVFYGYTKMIKAVSAYDEDYGMPDNLRINFSEGGLEDDFMRQKLHTDAPLPREQRKSGYSIVVDNEDEAMAYADELGIPENEWVYIPAGSSDQPATTGKQIMFLQKH